MRPADEQPSADGVIILREKLALLGHLAGVAARDAQRATEAIETGAADVESVGDEVRRARATLTAIGDFATRGSSAHHLFSLPPLAAGAIDLVHDYLTRVGITLHTEGVAADGQTGMILGDASRMEQVLVCLLVTAARTMADHDCGSTVWLRIHTHGSEARVIVEDDGPGVPLNVQRSIFNPDLATSTEPLESGFGLSVSASVVANHGGRLHVADRPAGGSCVTITLPTVPTRPRHHAAPDPSADVDEVRAHVLLVDDEAGIRRSVGRFLRRQGCTVHTASTGEQALDDLRAGSFDVVISDLRMPGLSGEELFDVVRREFPDMTSRIAFMSGDMIREETQTFLRRCGCPSLQKPYELQELMEIIDELCPADDTAGGAPREYQP